MATRAKRRGSWPRAIDMTRSALAMFALAMRSTAAAAASTSQPERLGDRALHRRRASARSSGTRPREAGVVGERAEHDVRVGHGRVRRRRVP